MTPGIISNVGRFLPMVSLRDFLAAGWALLVPQRPKGKVDLKPTVPPENSVRVNGGCYATNESMSRSFNQHAAVLESVS